MHAFVETAGEAFKRNGIGDITWLEKGLRECSNKACLEIILGLLSTHGLNVSGDERLKGERKVSGVSRTLHTIFGDGPISRNWYKPADGEGRFPLDEALGLVDGYTPMLAGLICQAAATLPFNRAAGDFNAYTGLEIDGRQFHRLANRVGLDVEKFLRAKHETPTESPPRVYVMMDGTGAPLRHDELKDRKGKGEDGKSQTHEVKVAAIFTEHPRPGEDPWRDLDSTTYVATDERCEAFGGMVRAEFLRRFKNVPETLVLGDAAEWIGNAAEINFPQATRIIDFNHASEHVGSMAEIVAMRDSVQWRKLRRKWTGKLWRGKIDALACAARSAFPKDKTDAGEKALAYFIKNRDAMRYDTFRDKGYFIGSGVVEAACRTIVGQRFKCSGMHWSQIGLKHLLAIRTAILSNRYDAFWNWRRKSKAA
jgi:hypothetical protein